MASVFTVEQANAMLTAIIVQICPLHLTHTYNIGVDYGEEQVIGLKKEQGVAARAEITLHNPKKPIENSYIVRKLLSCIDRDTAFRRRFFLVLQLPGRGIC